MVVELQVDFLLFGSMEKGRLCYARRGCPWALYFSE
jgi:hypothetical protein